MKIPIIKYSDKFLDRISILFKIGGITLFPWIILREKHKETSDSFKTKTLINHESIHIEQQKELFIIFFYIWYVLEWFIRLFMFGNAYLNISFEKEARLNSTYPDYIKNRKKYSFLKYLK